MTAASSFASAIRSPETKQPGSTQLQVQASPGSDTIHKPIGLSPCEIVELRLKKLNELKELQSLLQQNILTEEEFTEQKLLVLSSLRKLA